MFAAESGKRREGRERGRGGGREIHAAAESGGKQP